MSVVIPTRSRHVVDQADVGVEQEPPEDPDHGHPEHVGREVGGPEEVPAGELLVQHHGHGQRDHHQQGHAVEDELAGGDHRLPERLAGHRPGLEQVEVVLEADERLAREQEVPVVQADPDDVDGRGQHEQAEQDQVRGQEQVGDDAAAAAWGRPGPTRPRRSGPAPGPAAGGEARPPRSVVVIAGYPPYFFWLAASSSLAFEVALVQGGLGRLLAQHGLVDRQLEGGRGDLADARAPPAGT